MMVQAKRIYTLTIKVKMWVSFLFLSCSVFLKEWKTYFLCFYRVTLETLGKVWKNSKMLRKHLPVTCAPSIACSPKLPLVSLIDKLTSVFLCICPLIDDKLGHNIAKVAVKPRAAGEWFGSKLWQCYDEIYRQQEDRWKTDVNLFFTITRHQTGQMPGINEGKRRINLP